MYQQGFDRIPAMIMEPFGHKYRYSQNLNEKGSFKFKNGCPSNTFYLNKKTKQLIINKII